jgi:hypothetical protein
MKRKLFKLGMFAALSFGALNAHAYTFRLSVHPVEPKSETISYTDYVVKNEKQTAQISLPNISPASCKIDYGIREGRPVAYVGCTSGEGHFGVQLSAGCPSVENAMIVGNDKYKYKIVLQCL